MSELWRIAYLLLAAASATFAVGVLGMGLAEGLGPTTERTGRLLDTEIGERTVCDRIGNSSSNCREVDTFEVWGVFDDGTAFSKRGEAPYRAVKGENGPIQVITSNITGRVLSLDSETGSWKSSPGWAIVIGLMLCVSWMFVPLILRQVRRAGRWQHGAFRRPEWLAVVPGVVLALILLGRMGLTIQVLTGTPSAGDAAGPGAQGSGVFLESAFDYALVQAEIGNGPGTAVNEVFGSTGGTMATVGLEHLTAEEVAAWQAAEVFAVPIHQEGRRSTLYDLSFLAGTGDNLVRSTRCPDGLRNFPDEIGPGPNYGGFVCFDAALEGTEFHVVFDFVVSEVFRPAYQTSDGTTVEN